MKFLGNGLKSAAAASALSVFLVACGGSEPASSNDTPAPTDVEAAVTDATDAAEDAATDAADTVEAAAEDATEAASDAADTVEAAAEDATDAVDAAVEDAADAADAAVEDATETVEAAADDAAEVVEAAADDRVSAETIAEYAALTGNAQNGRRVFTQCMSCHAVQEGRNMAGPSLYGIVGRPAGTIEGFRYSDANANSGIVWTEPTMFAYLERPQQFIPGTIMAFPGIPRAQDRADVIAYLKEQSGQ
ncbi:MAG: cytochrome c family protein [Hyphomonadaceae bacterium]|nr:cytochrome c family protein [Hyphomonadaceae bacterium]